MPSDWTDCGYYWVNNAPQGSDRWHSLRNRITASKFSCVKQDNLEELAKSIVNPNKYFVNEAMQHGIITEPIAREWYIKKYNCQVREVGLAVPKWNPNIGASLDGDIVGTKGIIEIKCPQRMYRPINEYLEKIKQGWKPPTGYHEHIWDSHYDQMQGGMAICNKEWCDYIVYCTSENKVFVQRVLFDPKYWYGVLYPRLCNFVTHYLKPLLEKQGKEIEIPC